MKNIITPLLFAFAIASATASGYAGVDRFTNISPEGANVSKIVIDRLKPSTIYAVSSEGIFTSRNAGETWSLALDANGIDTGQGPSPGSALAVAPNDSSTVYAGTETGAILKSEDGGETWSVLPGPGARVRVADLVIDRSSSQTIYALSSFDLLRSSDGGASWTSLRAGLPEVVPPNWQLLTFVIDPSRSAVLYLGTTRGLYVSHDRGLQWKVVPGIGAVHRIAVDPNDPATIHVAEYPSIATTRDEGKTWTRSSTGPAQQFVTDEASSTIYALVAEGQSSRIVATTDRGVTWKARSSSLPILNVYAIEPGAAMTIYGAGEGNVVKSIDSGASWRRINAGLRGVYIRDVAVNSSDSSTLFATTQQGVVKSTDGGNHWSDTKLDLKNAWLTMDPNHAATLYAMSWNGTARSANDGETWTTITPRIAQRLDGARGIAVDPSNSAILYAVLANGVARSSDGGSAWTSLAIAHLPLGYYGFDGQTIAVDPETSMNLYAAGGSGIIKSADGGSTWQTVVTDYDAYFRKLLIDPRNPSIVYALAYQVLYRSGNGGLDWQPIYSAPAGSWFADLELDPLQPSRLYLATGAGVFKSSYRGDEWTEFNEGLPKAHVGAVTVDSAGSVYAATNRGLFVNSPRHPVMPRDSTLSVSLRASAGNYVSANRCGGTFVDANATDPGACETFAMRDLNGGALNHGDAVVLQAPDGGFVVAEGGETAAAVVNVNRGVAAAWETFTIHRTAGAGRITSGDSIALRASSGSYIAADGGGRNGCNCDSRLTADRAEVNAWETFVITIR